MRDANNDVVRNSLSTKEQTSARRLPSASVHHNISSFFLCRQEQIQQSLQIHDNLIRPQLALSIDPIHKYYRYFPNPHPRLVRTDQYFHLEGILSSTLHFCGNICSKWHVVRTVGTNQ
jgi:hypothetical protein